ncbi:hypothetical protein DPMN_098004 [Dreissena polymorpha]|uniref:Uncharacterized protein n=1 Tax=Dreissena polymorpha TaxID=45954 RepID=A0A9D4R687_DREPO|nr:hypothetical protein DPMN_098004 [Dreissena polymorpha]
MYTVSGNASLHFCSLHLSAVYTEGNEESSRHLLPSVTMASEALYVAKSSVTSRLSSLT